MKNVVFDVLNNVSQQNLTYHLHAYQQKMYREIATTKRSSQKLLEVHKKSLEFTEIMLFADISWLFVAIRRYYDLVWLFAAILSNLSSRGWLSNMILNCLDGLLDPGMFRWSRVKIPCIVGTDRVPWARCQAGLCLVQSWWYGIFGIQQTSGNPIFLLIRCFFPGTYLWKMLCLMC